MAKKEKIAEKPEVQEEKVEEKPQVSGEKKWVKVSHDELVKLEAEGRVAGYNRQTGEALI